MKAFLERSGQEALPLVLVNGEVALAGRYPTRTELARWTGLDDKVAARSAASAGCGASGCC